MSQKARHVTKKEVLPLPPCFIQPEMATPIEIVIIVIENGKGIANSATLLHYINSSSL